MRDRLIDLLWETGMIENENRCHIIADELLENGVIVTPCVAMVEQFLKDGKFDKEIHVHNGKYAVVYVDKSKWGCPLIDITEQRYNSEKAEERIQALKGGVQE